MAALDGRGVEQFVLQMIPLDALNDAFCGAVSFLFVPTMMGAYISKTYGESEDDRGLS